jgi:hypothetical protein
LNASHLAQHGTLAREQMANQLTMEREKKSPDSLKASMMLGLAQRAAGDPSFDYERVPSIMGELDRMMGQFGTGLPNSPQSPAGPMRGGDARGLAAAAPLRRRGAAARRPAAGQADAAAAGGPDDLPTPADARVGGDGAGRQGRRVLHPAKPEELTQQKMLDAVIPPPGLRPE